MLFSRISAEEDIKVDPYLQDKIQNMIDRQSPTDYITKEQAAQMMKQSNAA